MNGFEVGQGGPKPTTKIYRVLAAIGDSTTVSQIEQATGLDQDHVRSALLVLRARNQVVRLNKGRPNYEAGIFAITQTGRDLVAATGSVDPIPATPPVSMVAHALSRRHHLATVWMSQ